MYAEAINGKLKHYRDSSGQEIDAIIETRNGDYCTIEIKIYSEKNISFRTGEIFFARVPQKTLDGTGPSDYTSFS